MKEYFRPKTRGELKDKIKEGVECEVASFVVEMNNMLLTGWLDFKDFKTRPSENEGWTIYYKD
jgi:hypothetical protein